MRHPCVGIEVHVVRPRVPRQRAPGPSAQRGNLREAPLEAPDGFPGGREQLQYLVAARTVGRVAALLDLAQAMVQGLDQLAAAFGVLNQVVLEEGIAVDDPDVSQYFVQHARRTAGAPFAAQLVEQAPSLLAEQPDDDFAVRQRGVVVRDLPQTRDGAIQSRCGLEAFGGGG